MYAVLVVEVKAVFLGQAHLWRNGLPDHVLAQALWYQDLTGLPVVVVALLVNAWGATKESALTVAECSEIRFYDLPVDANAKRRSLIVETVQRVRDEGLVVPAFVPPPPPRPPEGTLDDGVLAAQWLRARADLEAAREAKRVAAFTVKAAATNLDNLSLRLRTRVGLGESMLAGGWRVSVGTNGAIRVR